MKAFHLIQKVSCNSFPRTFHCLSLCSRYCEKVNNFLFNHAIRLKKSPSSAAAYSALQYQDVLKAFDKFNSAYQQNRPDKALQIFEQSIYGKTELTRGTYVSIIQKCIKYQQPHLANIIMRKWMINIDGMIPEVKLYNSLFNGFRKHSVTTSADNTANIEQVFFQMVYTDCIKPTRETFHHLIQSYLHSGNLNKARRTFEDMHHFFNISYDVETLHLMTQSYSEAHTHGYTIIHEYIQEESIQKAINLLTIMQQGNIPLTYLKIDTNLFNLFLTKIMSDNQISSYTKKYIPLLQSMVSSPDLDTIKLLVRYYVEHDLTEAVRLVQKMQKSMKLDIEIYHCIISAYCKSGRMKNAIHMVKDMKTYNVEPNTNTLNILIEGYVGMKDMRSALRIFKKMKSSVTGSTYPNTSSPSCPPSKNFPSNFEDEFITPFLPSNNIQQPTPSASETSFKNIKPNIDTFEVLILGYAKEKQYTRVSKLLQEMKELNIEPNDRIQDLLNLVNIDP